MGSRFIKCFSYVLSNDALVPVTTAQHRVAAHFPMEHNLNNF